MDPGLVIAATPLFFLTMLIDWALCRSAGIYAYRLMPMLADLSSGCGQQALALFLVGLGTAVYDRMATLALFPLTPSPLSWLVLLILDDLLFYLFHRASHRINLLWAAHAVHHQSEDYNLAVALRQSWLSPLLGLPFFLPLSILGFPTAMVVMVRTINTLYQFWVHTRAVRHLGWLEKILNTPSHHRVHHGCDREYLDSNYGGIFILWDRLFGTFVAERSEPRYGTVKPLRSWNAAWANIVEFQRLGRLARQARSLREQVLTWLGPPEWCPRSAEVPEENVRERARDDRRPKPWVQGYCLFNLLVTIVGVDLLLLHHSRLRCTQSVAAVALALASLLCVGGIADGRRWARWAEVARLAMVLSGTMWLR
jgi:sterol desaturase/sphingolipid hydroxylase (fatty acid hydroxylase superfamily)